MPAGDYIEGALLFGGMLGGVLFGAWLLTRRRLGHLRGSTRVIAFALLATLGIVVVHLVPGTLGLLGRGSVLAATALWAAAAALVPRASCGVAAVLEPGEEDRSSVIPASICGAALVIFGLAFLFDQASIAPGSIDILNFHLPGVVRWIETGSIWQVDNLLPNVAPGNYPNTGDVILLAAILPWHNDFLSHLSMYPFWALTGVATYTLARELGARRSASVLAGSLVVAVPAVAAPALVHSLVDTVMLFGFAAGCAFLLRHNRTDATSDLVLAGIALGLSFGTKWYGVSAVAIVVVVWAGAGFLAKRGWRPLFVRGMVLTGLIALTGGIWMVRNLAESGNPVFPVKVAPAGFTIFDAPHDVVRELGGFTILDYVGDWDVWSGRFDADPRSGDAYVLPQLRRALAAPAALALVGLFAALALIARKPRRAVIPGAERWTAALVAAMLIALAYLITPYTAGGPEGQPILVGADARYLVPAIVIAAALGAALVSWSGAWLSPLVGALALVATFDGISWAARGELTPGRLGVADVAGASLVAGLGAAGIYWIRKRRDGRTSVPALAVVGLAVLLVSAASVAGYEAQQRFNDDRYKGSDAVLDFILEEAPAGQRVGLTGAWDDVGTPPVLPAFGPRFQNEVEYVGKPVEEFLHPYENADEFKERLRQERFDYLIVGRGRPAVPQGNEAHWARAAGYTPLVQSDRFILLRASS